MSRFQQLPRPIDLPEGTAAIVKVQQPPEGRGDHLHWIIFAKGIRHFRLYRREHLPEWVIEAIGDRRKAYFHAEVCVGEWRFLAVSEDQPW